MHHADVGERINSKFVSGYFRIGAGAGIGGGRGIHPREKNHCLHWPTEMNVLKLIDFFTGRNSFRVYSCHCKGNN